MLIKTLKNSILIALLTFQISPSFALNIVLTNDDGFETPNIQALYYALKKDGHDVILSAPYLGQSGAGGQLPFLKPIGNTTKPSAAGLLPIDSSGVGETTIAPQQYYVDASPATALLYGVDIKAKEIWGEFPDLVISGPNEGNNLGILTPHSGTLGATVTAINKGIPAIAVSAEGKDAESAKIIAALVVKLVRNVQTKDKVNLYKGTGLNVNFPKIDPTKSSANDFSFEFTRIGRSASYGIQFYQHLGQSTVAATFGLSTSIQEPGISIKIPATKAGYPQDSDPKSESNALRDLVVTVSVIQGTYAADRATERRTKRKIKRLFQ